MLHKIIIYFLLCFVWAGNNKRAASHCYTRRDFVCHQRWQTVKKSTYIRGLQSVRSGLRKLMSDEVDAAQELMLDTSHRCLYISVSVSFYSRFLSEHPLIYCNRCVYCNNVGKPSTLVDTFHCYVLHSCLCKISFNFVSVQHGVLNRWINCFSLTVSCDSYFIK